MESLTTYTGRVFSLEIMYACVEGGASCVLRRGQVNMAPARETVVQVPEGGKCARITSKISSSYCQPLSQNVILL